MTSANINNSCRVLLRLELIIFIQIITLDDLVCMLRGMQASCVLFLQGLIMCGFGSEATADGLEHQVGFDIEFTHLNLGGTNLEGNVREFSTAVNLRNRFPIFEEVLQILEHSGIDVQQFHTEGSA